MSPASVVADLKTSEVFTYQLNFVDYSGQTTYLTTGTPVSILFDENQDLTSISSEISPSGLVIILFTAPGTFFVKGYDVGGQDLHPITKNGPTLFQVSQGTCP